MPNFVGEIKGIVAGDDFDVVRTITNLPLGVTLTDAWFTVKAVVTDSDANALVKKRITPTQSADGIISDVGTDRVAEIIFYILPSDSDQLGGPVRATTGFVYDIQVRTNLGRVYTPEIGKIVAETQVTRAVS